MPGAHKPKTGLAEALFVILLTAAGEFFGMFIPFLGSIILVLTCQVYVFLRGLPYVASLVGAAIDTTTSSWSFAQTIGMIFVFLADHNPKLGKVAELASQVSSVKGAAKSAAVKTVASNLTKELKSSATSKITSAASAGGRRERWFTERGGATATKPGISGAPSQASTETPASFGGSAETPASKSKTPFHRKTSSGSQNDQQSQGGIEGEGEDLADEIFQNPVEKLEESLERLPTLEDIQKGMVVGDEPRQMFMNQVKKNGNLVVLPKQSPTNPNGKNKLDMVKSTGNSQRPLGTRSESEEELRKAA